jgi:hypothetical protein
LHSANHACRALPAKDGLTVATAQARRQRFRPGPSQIIGVPLAVTPVAPSGEQGAPGWTIKVVGRGVGVGLGVCRAVGVGVGRCVNVGRYVTVGVGGWVVA